MRSKSVVCMIFFHFLHFYMLYIHLIVFRLWLFFIEVDILLLYIINNDLKVDTKKFDHILVHTGHTSIKRPPLLNGHLAIPQGWPLNRGSTVTTNYTKITDLTLFNFNIISCQIKRQTRGKYQYIQTIYNSHHLPIL